MSKRDLHDRLHHQSRAARHSISAWLGIHYGRHILRLWNHLSARYATTILIVIWTAAIIMSCAIAFWRLYKTSARRHHSPGRLGKRF